MAGIDKITIKGFKSIKELNDFPLRNLNILIGANGSGKSNFLGFFKFVRAVYEGNFYKYTLLSGGANSFLHFGRKKTEGIHCNIEYKKINYALNFFPGTKDEFAVYTHQAVFSKTSIVPSNKDRSYNVIRPGYYDVDVNTKDPASRVISTRMKNIKSYHFHDTSDSAAVKQMHPINDNLSLKFDAANLAPYLYYLHKKYPPYYRIIVNAIKVIAPFFHDFVIRDDNPDYVELEWFHQDDLETPNRAHLLSDGTLRFMCLAALLLQPPEKQPDTIIIDEPELGLHPAAIHQLSAMFQQVAEKKQLIIATQSVELMNYFTPEDIIVTEMEDGASTFKRLDGKELSDWLDNYTLSELWTSNVIGGNP